MNLKEILNKEVYIFDLDGTLYSQTKLRMHMALKLMLYFSLHPQKLRELCALQQFRKIRESEEYRCSSMAEQIAFAARKAGISVEQANAAIGYWMFDAPLESIRQHTYQDAVHFIRSVQLQGKTVVIYSDYPTSEKLIQLGLSPDRTFSPGDGIITELKPSPKAMQQIMQTLLCRAEDILYIGDRDEKDGLSARYEGIPYCDIRLFRQYLKKWSD